MSVGDSGGRAVSRLAVVSVVEVIVAGFPARRRLNRRAPATGSGGRADPPAAAIGSNCAMPKEPQVVLITGCSTGIGRATAARLAAAGHTVYATARRPETLAELRDAGCRPLALDVTDEDSMQAAVAAVAGEHGAVGVLVNNAGYSQSGAVETVTPESLRRQFETNVFGLVRMCQLVLPGMRERRAGRIVNVSSMEANVTFPCRVIYPATKSAWEP